MLFKKRPLLSGILALLLIISMACPISATTVEPRASYYLDSYSAYIYPAGWGKVQVWVTVHGVEPMDEVGALYVQIYESTDQENWTWVQTFRYTDYPDLLGYNSHYNTGHIEYAGTIGRYYKAYICVWAGKDGDGDTRYFWIGPEKATLFAG